jgi:histidinol-phosphate phosphatase family protein
LNAEPASTRLRQAVVLAGGRGERLLPLTLTRPKAMVEFHGRPFLEYLVEMLRDQGIERILLLLGYLPDPIVDHFGDGSAFGVRIDVDVTPPDDSTSARLAHARDLIDPVFLMLYCDNYWPLLLDRHVARFDEAGAPALVTVYRNADRHSRDNVRIDADGFVAVYDKSRAAPDLGGNEIGYAILRRELLDLVPEGSGPIEAALYPTLIRDRRLAALVTDHRYYSVGSPERLPVTERFLARRPTVFLDRDGVLNRRPAVADYIRLPEQVEWLPGALDAIRRLTVGGVRLIVISNQAGIARGAMSPADLAAVEDRMRGDVEAAGGRIEAFLYCPHGWDEGCACRKPRPGMLFEAQRRFDLDLTRTPFVGDDERDGQAAAAAGSPFLLVTEDRGLSEVTDGLLSGGLTTMTGTVPAGAQEVPA